MRMKIEIIVQPNKRQTNLKNNQSLRTALSKRTLKRSQMMELRARLLIRTITLMMDWIRRCNSKEISVCGMPQFFSHQERLVLVSCSSQAINLLVPLSLVSDRYLLSLLFLFRYFIDNI